MTMSMYMCNMYMCNMSMYMCVCVCACVHVFAAAAAAPQAHLLVGELDRDRLVARILVPAYAYACTHMHVSWLASLYLRTHTHVRICMHASMREDQGDEAIQGGVREGSREVHVHVCICIAMHMHIYACAHPGGVREGSREVHPSLLHVERHELLSRQGSHGAQGW